MGCFRNHLRSAPRQLLMGIAFMRFAATGVPEQLAEDIRAFPCD